MISPVELKALESELGGVLWYLAQVATELGLSLDAIASHNIAKLLDRSHVAGFAAMGTIAKCHPHAAETAGLQETHLQASSIRVCSKL